MYVCKCVLLPLPLPLPLPLLLLLLVGSQRYAAVGLPNQANSTAQCCTAVLVGGNCCPIYICYLPIRLRFHPKTPVHHPARSTKNGLPRLLLLLSLLSPLSEVFLLLVLLLLCRYTVIFLLLSRFVFLYLNAIALIAIENIKYSYVVKAIVD